MFAARVRLPLFVSLILPLLAYAQEGAVSEKRTLSAASTVAYTNSMEVLDDRRTLGVGDRVSFRVVEDRKEPITLTVTDSGEMEIPLIGRVPAASKTCKQLAYAIKAPLERTYFYKATVIVGLDTAGALKSKGRIYITGQVRSSGPMELPPDEALTVSKAILRAGGLADFANKRKVRVVRKVGNSQTETETTVVDLEEIMEKGRSERDMILKPDDMIIVPERLINF